MTINNNIPFGTWKTQYFQDLKKANTYIQEKGRIYNIYQEFIERLVAKGQGVIPALNDLSLITSGYLRERILKIQVKLVPGIAPASFHALYDDGAAAKTVNYYLNKIRNYENYVKLCDNAEACFMNHKYVRMALNEIRKLIKGSIDNVHKKLQFFRDHPEWFRKEVPYSDSLGLDILKRLKCQGKGVEIGIIESHKPLKHSALANCVSDFNKENEPIANHATAVCFLLAGKTPDGFFTGILPKAKIKLVALEVKNGFNGLDALNFSSIKVVNCSFRFNCENITSLESSQLVNGFDFSVINEHNRFWKALACVNGKEKLVVQAIGNGIQVEGIQDFFGVNLSANPITQCDFHYLEEEAIIENFILVMNVDKVYQDGVYLSPSSNTPGLYYHSALCAPGTEIETAGTGDNREGYFKFSGTSAAAPFVTGIAAALQQEFPSLTIREIKRCLLDGARPLLLINGQATFVDNVDLSIYPADLIIQSQSLFGRGYLDARGAFRVAQAIMAEKELPAKRRKLEKNIHKKF